MRGKNINKKGKNMKVKELIKYTSSEELYVKKQIKKLFDPKGIMNPGKVFD